MGISFDDNGCPLVSSNMALWEIPKCYLNGRILELMFPSEFLWVYLIFEHTDIGCDLLVIMFVYDSTSN